jgi:outer membrane protein TolC
VRVSEAAADAVVRRATREIVDAVDALRAAEAQQAVLAPHLGDDARRALTAAQTAYNEGDITLVDWLDAVRAYHDAQAIYTTVLAEVVVRQATLAQALGISLLDDPASDGGAGQAPPARRN